MDLGGAGTGLGSIQASDFRPRSTFAKYCRSAPIVTTAAWMIDAALLMFAVALSSAVQGSADDFSPGELLLSGGVASLTTCACLSSWGAYRVERLSGRTASRGALPLSVLVGAVVFAACLGLLPAMMAGQAPDLRIRSLLWAAFALLFLSAMYRLWVHLFSAWDIGEALCQRVALVGDNFSDEFIRRVMQETDSGIRIVGRYTDVSSQLDPTWRSDHVDGCLDDLVVRALSGDIDAIVHAVPLTETARINHMRYVLRNVSADIYVTVDLEGLGFSVDRSLSIGRSPLVNVQRRPLNERQQLQKRMFDSSLAIILVVALLPLLLLVALGIRLDSQGPILFKQARFGLNNRIFTVYKFRTMFHRNESADLDGTNQARRGDPRITRIGKWLRKLSIDELPQLLNVIRGEMSLVGPRPHPLNTQVGGRLLQDAVAGYAARHRVLPGITGWAQICGWRGETVVMEQIEQRVAHDLYYIENWSLIFDVKILLLTLKREIIGGSAF
jgi:Undecaprenyl-phosphate glucose phosphotransferase